MKNIFFFLLILSNIAFAEECAWRWINPLPQGNDLEYIKFVSKDVAFISGKNGTLLKSTDAGLTWNIIKLMNYRSNYDFFFDENNILLVDDRFLATNNPDSNWADKNIYKTTDGGKNWTKSTTKVFQIEFDYRFHFLDMNTGYYVPENKDSVILKTTNCGSSWDTIKMPLLIDYSNRVIIRNTDLFYIFNKNFIMKTTDGGVSWKNLENLPEAEYKSIYFYNDNVAWINSSIGLLKTTDSGESWNIVRKKALNNMTNLKFINENVGYSKSITGLRQIYKTTDGGANWKRISAGTGFDSEISSFAVSQDEVFIGIGDNGIIKRTTDDGITWLNMDKGFKDDLTNIQFIDNVNGWITGKYGTIFKTTDGGNSWEDKKSNVLNDDIYLIKFFNNNIGIISGYYQSPYGNKLTFYKTTNGGEEWIELGNITDIYTFSSFFLNEQIGWTIVESRLLEYYLYKTTDGGEYWSFQKSFKDTAFTCLKFFDENNGYALLGNIYLLKTTDGGNNWSNTQLDTNIYYYNLTFINENIGWIVGRNKENLYSAYKTTDAGNTWLPKLESSYLSGLGFLDENIGWVKGNNDSTFKTTNGGENWEYYSIGTDYSKIGLYIKDENTCWAVGRGGAVLKFSCEASSIEDEHSNVEDYSGINIFPNPAKSEITISFPNNYFCNEKYNIALYNSYGEKVKQIDFSNNHKITTFSVSELSSGCYFIHINNGKNVISKPIIISK